MPDYRVTWSIDVDASDPLAAAVTAQSIVRDPSNLANVYEVSGEGSHPLRVDLAEIDNNPLPDWIRISEDPGADYIIDFGAFVNGLKPTGSGGLSVTHTEAYSFGDWHQMVTGGDSEFIDTLDRARLQVAKPT